MNADLIVYSDARPTTVYLLSPGTPRGEEWLGENVDAPEYARMGKGVAVEHGYLLDILNGARKAGLTIAKH